MTAIAPAADCFRHEALFYAGQEEFVTAAAAFIRDGLAADEPILTVVSAAKIDMLRDQLGADADRVCFADMSEVGTNPARIIPAWQDFVDEASAGGRTFRGIGEPIWGSRTPAELIECQRHESLLNLAFAGLPAWYLLCPYDTTTLADDVIDAARRTHPFVVEGAVHQASGCFEGIDGIPAVLDVPLPAPPADAGVFHFGDRSLIEVRRFVARYATEGGLADQRAEDLVLAVNELVTNSLRHGGGGGTLRVWHEPGVVVCEVTDAGTITDPLAGRRLPDSTDAGGRGLWLVNQLCELVQVRSLPAGNVVRAHMQFR